ncbi:glutamyl-tRNA amidotransferase C subunit [Heterostelium album PN500]|uniref:Glutamyl-tRNA amidotransferase C subunit n=1 Tax=Heterostelium pallidum (strain ATCC 26659 / Pp 5 / PN500) TaxID=670386 RepID=D3BI38_HETP5|nr:glutamyl-tRNA amidotransferase C subunit [Heterostelium album PN500]EFA78938.1 glutamyl-tRNA amidotransferase C subunit [Heterostelium album PN500]|eukprot:XP_020431062.1 glutamyl-tRNA amidotransferase C subunit [Heterostelium album PN500]
MIRIVGVGCQTNKLISTLNRSTTTFNLYKRYSTNNVNSIDWNKRWSVVELLESKQKSHSIPVEKLRHLASLSMLEIKEEDVDRYCQQLGGVLQAVDAMQQVDTNNVLPLRTLLEDQSLLLRKETTVTPAEQQSTTTTISSQNQKQQINNILQHSSHTLSNFYKVPHRGQTSSSESKSNKKVISDQDEIEEE